jgi:hypothetical protein
LVSRTRGLQRVFPSTKLPRNLTSKVASISSIVPGQFDLLSLFQDSKQLIAEESGHFIIIDRPDAVIDAISQVVRSVRKNAKL